MRMQRFLLKYDNLLRCLVVIIVRFYELIAKPAVFRSYQTEKIYRNLTGKSADGAVIVLAVESNRVRKTIGDSITGGS